MNYYEFPRIPQSEFPVGAQAYAFPAIPEIPEFPDNVLKISAGKYVISQNHEINGTVEFEENVMLYFTTGMLIGTGVLTGNYTNIQAPIAQIFGENLTVEGRWTIDRAYPQWFGAKICRGYNYLINPYYDASVAINKAIKMKRTGEVFIPRGEYMVRKTIMVSFGINLIGETGLQAYDMGDDTILRPQGTILKPMIESEVNKNDFTAGYMVMVNVQNPGTGTTPAKASWVVEYPAPITFIKNISFANISTNVIGLKCILVAGGFVFDSLNWDGFRQAVATVNCYSDLKQIKNCSFSGGDSGIDDSYVFDLPGLGDGLLFEHNAMHDFRYKALRLSGCFGGSVTANILNGDTKIDSCKAVTFSGNHCEGDPQIHIIASGVSLDNNYIEKGKRPSIFLEGGIYNEMPVVELNNNLFMFYDYDRSDGDFKKPVDGICEYDIAMKRDVLLNISNTFRYWIGPGLGGKMYPCGVSIQRVITDSNNNIIDYQPFEKFNHFSQLLSPACEIMPNAVVLNDTYVDDINSQGLIMGKAGGEWSGESNLLYKYKYSIIWDYDRKILKTDATGKSLFDLNTDPIKTAEGQLILFAVSSDGEYYSRQVMVRLYRFNVSNAIITAEYVDVPLCGTKYFYDNGVSVCGYKWKEYTNEGDEFVSINKGIKSIRYHGNNIECWSDNAPIVNSINAGKWKRGDIIYNINSQSSDNVWVIKDDININ